MMRPLGPVGVAREASTLARSARLLALGEMAFTPSAETVAAAAGIGSRQLSALFRKHLGTTLVNYVNTEKIQRVKQLILTEGASLETAGAAVGIENTKYLSTLFHKHTGMTIRQYKQMCR